MSQEATHGIAGSQEPKDTLPDCCQGMAEKMVSFGPVMEQMMARCGPMMEPMMAGCMESMTRETPSGEATEPTRE